MKHLCHLHRLVGVFFSLVFLFSNHAHSFTTDRLFSDFASDGNIVLTKSQCEKKYLFTQFDDPTQPQVTPQEAFELDYQPALNFISWIPDGLSTSPMSKNCRASSFESALLTSSNHREFATRMRSHFSNCQGELENNWPGSSQGLAKMLSTKYELCDHPMIKKVHFRVDPYYKIRGYLALKPGTSKKPLVIIMCGAYCDSGDRTTKTILMQTYDVGPFHALLLGNFTGGEFVSDNNRIAIGGFEEGKKVYRIAKYFKEGPLSKVISTVHVVGMSLGGHAALYSSYYNDFNPINVHQNKANDRAIDSIFSLCPVVDLETSITRLFQQDINGALMRIIFWSELESITKVIPILGDIFRPDGSLAKNPDLPTKIAEQASGFLKTSNKVWRLAPEQNTPVVDDKQFYGLNHFNQYALKVKDTPVITSGSKNDWVVLYDQNSKVLYEHLEKNPGISSIEPLPVSFGNHCAFSQGYGWRNITALFRSFILKNAPEILTKKRDLKQAFIPAFQRFSFNIQPQEKLIEARWTFKPFRNMAQIELSILRGDRKKCEEESIQTTEGKCIRTTSAMVNTLELPMELRRIPRTETEAEELSRWANTNIELLDENSILVKDSGKMPTTIRWTTFR